jgi:integrase
MLRTKSGLPKHCTYEIDRYGKRRVRFRRRGVSVYLTGIPWSERFMREYAVAVEREQGERPRLGSTLRTLPGSFSALCVSYYSSQEFRDLRGSTQAVRRNILEGCRAQHGHRLLKDLRHEHVDRIIRDKAKTPEAGNNLLKVLRVLLNHGVANGLIASNPALGVKGFKSKNPDGLHSWSEAEIAQFQAAHAIGSRAGLALALALHTGQRRSAVLRMGWQHVNGDRITVQQQKTGRTLVLPTAPELMQALTSVPRTNMTFLLTEYGKPFSPNGFNSWFRRKCDEAGLPRCCTLHGLRKAAATRLANAGCSEHEIAAVTGHRSMREVERYTRAANQEQLAEQAMARRRART